MIVTVKSKLRFSHYQLLRHRLILMAILGFRRWNIVSMSNYTPKSHICNKLKSYQCLVMGCSPYWPFGLGVPNSCNSVSQQYPDQTSPLILGAFATSTAGDKKDIPVWDPVCKVLSRPTRVTNQNHVRCLWIRLRGTNADLNLLLPE